MKVLKFGGTSVGSSSSMREVIDIIANYKKSNINVAMVSSAMSGVTNKLVEMGQKASQNECLSPRPGLDAGSGIT